MQDKKIDDKRIDDKRIEVLRDMDTGKAIIKLALPAILGFVVMAVYNVVDTLFVSWWSYEGIAATQVVFPIMMVSSALGLTFGIGAGSYISRLLGEENKKRANAVLSTSLYTSLIIAVLYVALLLPNLRAIVISFGAVDNIVNLSVDYGFYIVIGALFIIPSMVFNNSLRAEGSAKYSMIGMAIGAVVNIILDPIFIFSLDLGVKGAAMATALSQLVSVLVLYAFYLRKKSMINLHFKYFKFDLVIYKEVFKVGLPTFFRQILFAFSMALLNNSAGAMGGDYLLSAMGIGIKVSSMVGYFIFGMGQGLQPVVGYNFGAKNLERVFSAQKNGMKQTFFGSLVGVIILLVFTGPILRFFTDEVEVLEYGYMLMRLFSIALLFMAVSNTVAVVFQALGYGKASLFFSVLRQGILLIPAILILPRFYGVYGVILAQPFADALTFLISICIYIPFIKKLKKKGSI